MASPTEASPPSAAWPNKDTVPQESQMNLMDGSEDRTVLTNHPRVFALIAGLLSHTEAKTSVGDDGRTVIKRNKRKGRRRSFTGTECQRKNKSWS